MISPTQPIFGIDALDRGIVGLLQRDGRRSFVDVGKELGVSESTVRHRYQRLVQAGVFQVVGVADPFRIGFASVALIGLRVAIDANRHMDEIAGEIAAFAEVSYAVLSAGTFDLLVEVIVRDPDELAAFLTDKLQRVRGVARTETFVLLRVYKPNLGGLAQVPVRLPQGADVEVTIDELDREIVALLQPDGRRSFVDVGRELGVSESTIRHRYHRLTVAGVFQVVGVADPLRIGLRGMAFVGITLGIDAHRRIDAVAAEIASMSEVSYAVLSAGTYDLIIEVILESPAALAVFLTERLQLVGGVARTETFMLLRIYKLTLGGWRPTRDADPAPVLDR